METYGQRNLLLVALGFANYFEYLKSLLWLDIRKQVLASSGGRCCLCLHPSTALHHTSYAYEVLIGEDFTKIVPICDGCRVKLEFKANGTKRTLADVQRLFNDKIKRVKPYEINKLPESERVGKKRWCVTCGKRAKKGLVFCRPCLKGHRASFRNEQSEERAKGVSNPSIGAYFKARQKSRNAEKRV